MIEHPSSGLMDILIASNYILMSRLLTGLLLLSAHFWGNALLPITAVSGANLKVHGVFSFLTGMIGVLPSHLIKFVSTY